MCKNGVFFGRCDLQIHVIFDMYFQHFGQPSGAFRVGSAFEQFVQHLQLVDVAANFIFVMKRVLCREVKSQFSVVNVRELFQKGT